MLPVKKKKVIRLVFETYLAVIKNSVNSRLFSNFYAKKNGKRTDIMKNGALSCAFYASSVLTLFKMIHGIHGTVDSTVKDLQKSGWKIARKPHIGSIIVWEKIKFQDGAMHKHIGFYMGNNQAISNSYKQGCPIKHHWTFENQRKIETILWNPEIMENFS